MRTSSALAGVLVIGILAGLAGCDSANSDWNKAVAQNSDASYKEFLTAHSKDKRATEARARISALRDDQAWSDATAEVSADGYKDYLRQWPAGNHDREARNALAAMAESTDWDAAQAEGSVAAVQAFLQKYPSGGLAAAQAKAKLIELSGFRAQLASDPIEAKAEQELAELKHRFGTQVPGLSVIAPTAQGGTYAIVSMGMSQTEAQETCDSLQVAHQSCEVIDGASG